MKKAIVIGDIHGRDDWKYQIENPEENKIIFIGDYVDSFGISNEKIINNLKDIIALKKDYPNNIELLLGNHDFMYMWISEPAFRCSGLRSEIALVLNNLFFENISLFKMATTHKDSDNQEWLFTHAGITQSWFSLARKTFPICWSETEFGKSAESVAAFVNNLLKVSRGKMTLAHAGPMRGGYNKPGPIWADWRELIKNPLLTILDEEVYINQIVGHTFIAKEDRPFLMHKPNGISLICIDNESEKEYILE